MTFVLQSKCNPLLDLEQLLQNIVCVYGFIFEIVWIVCYCVQVVLGCFWLDSKCFIKSMLICILDDGKFIMLFVYCLFAGMFIISMC